MTSSERKIRQLAFSLIEIVLAIGIISFSLLAMFGLVSVSLQSNRASASDTDLASMSRQVLATLRNLPFSSLPSATNYYFGPDGSPTNSAAALYDCAVTLTSDAAIPSGDFKTAQLQFTWPVTAGNRPNTNIFQISIANYGN